MLFSRVNLGGFTSHIRPRSRQLKELSKGDTKASALAKHLSIDYSSPFSNDPDKVFTPLEQNMLKHLKSAISSFRAITTMSWQIGRHEPLWAMEYIINELAAIPTLRDINLNYLRYARHIGNLTTFSNLHKIRVRVDLGPGGVILELGKLLAQCPALTDLDISIGDDMSQLFQFVDHAGKPLSLHHLSMDQLAVSPDCFKSAVRNFRCLQSLHLHRCSSSHSVGSRPTIWDILIEESIYIRNLSTDAVDDSLLRYLSSYEGLRKFSSIVEYDLISSPNQVHPINILRAMIPHHAESLAELDILESSTDQIIDWSPPFSKNLINLLSSFNNLRHFAHQLHLAPCYISMIESVLPICAKIFPELQRLVLHTPVMSYLR
ncbi:hypothetical protein BYT27DRAFT_7250270 [Phlegmacium glaucopus]|nr:hypothetical protein BYT27DRAFT_7250270 [Phlegmacium glaucopus]